MRPSGIEPATFRFVAQYFNHLATAVPICGVVGIEKEFQSVFKEISPMEIFNYFQSIEFLTVHRHCHILLTP